MKIDGIDHFVLTVKDVETTCAFYTKVLGMREITFGKGLKALSFGNQKINLHELGKEFEPKSLKPTAGSADLCFITTTPLTEMIEHLNSCNVEIIEGPVEKTGATGRIISVYFRDTDGNLIEVSTYESQRPPEKRVA